MRKVLLLKTLAVLSFAVGGCKCSPTADQPQSNKTDFSSLFILDKAAALSDLEVIAKQEHPFGSAEQAEVTKFLLQNLEKNHVPSMVQPFTAEVPNPDISDYQNPGMRRLTQTKSGTNIIAMSNAAKEKDCLVILGSHYDTKVVPGIKYLGANDSGSSTVVLLHLAKFISSRQDLRKTFPCGFAFVWFDGEESILNDWYDGEQRHPAKLKDNTYGSRYFVNQLTTCSKDSKQATYARHCFSFKDKQYAVVGLVLLDMVGSKNLKFSTERGSHPKLLAIRNEVAQKLGISSQIAADTKDIQDDHIPFVNLGIPSINLIDFENIYNWHNANDQISEISAESLEISARMALGIGASIAANPKDFLR